MISAQNLRLRLNGNNLIYALIVFYSVVMGSCSTPKIVSAPSKTDPKEEEKAEVYNPVTKKYEAANSQNTKVDTIVWKESTIPPLITDNTGAIDIATESDKTFQISLLLPLSEEDLNKDLSAENTEKYFHYYAGMKLAVEKLNVLDNDFHLKIYDVKASQDAIKSVLSNSQVRNSDLIIGPLRRDHLNETAKLSLERNIPHIAPWNSFRTLESINPNYILLKSSLPTHAEILSQYITKNFKLTDLAIVGRDKNKNLISLIQTELKKLNPSVPTITQSTVKDDYKFGEDYKYLDTTKSVYVVAEFEDPDVVFNFLRHINIMRRSRDITVIGMPSWQEYGRDYNSLFSQLHVTISSSSFPDGNNAAVNEFKISFFKAFQQFPLKEAYEGYDVMNYITQMMSKYGRNFHQNGDINTFQGLATKVKLEKIIDTSKPVDDRMNNSNVLCIENKALHVLKFDQYRFNKIQ